jgi:hypothetical protein
MDVVERGWGVWTGLILTRDRDKWRAQPSGSIKCWETIEWLHN